MDFVKRLDELEKLEAGWDGEDGEPINKNIISVVKEICSKVEYLKSHKGLKIFPVSDGRIDVEISGEIWITFDEYDALINFCNQGRILQTILLYSEEDFMNELENIIFLINPEKQAHSKIYVEDIY